MKLNAQLSPFNSRLAAELLSAFPVGAHAMEDDEGTLLIRVPTPSPTHPIHIGTHVAVSLEPEVKKALATAPASERELMTKTLIDCLGTQVRIQYDSNGVGQFALDCVGTMRTLEGLKD